MYKLWFSLIALTGSLNVIAMPLEDVFGVLDACEPIENRLDEIEFDNSNVYDQFALSVINREASEARALLNNFESVDRYILNLLAGLANDRLFLEELEIADRLSRESLIEFAFLSATSSNFEAVSYVKSAGIGPGEKIGDSYLATSLGICFFYSM